MMNCVVRGTKVRESTHTALIADSSWSTWTAWLRNKQHVGSEHIDPIKPKQKSWYSSNSINNNRSSQDKDFSSLEGVQLSVNSNKKLKIYKRVQWLPCPCGVQCTSLSVRLRLCIALCQTVLSHYYKYINTNARLKPKENWKSEVLRILILEKSQSADCNNYYFNRNKRGFSAVSSSLRLESN